MERTNGPVPLQDRLRMLLDRRPIGAIARFLKHHWASMIFLIAMGLSIFASGISWTTAQEQQKDQNKICETIVNGRNDLRQLLLDIAPSMTTPEGKVFIENLLKTRPEFECISGVPVQKG